MCKVQQSIIVSRKHTRHNVLAGSCKHLNTSCMHELILIYFVWFWRIYCSKLLQWCPRWKIKSMKILQWGTFKKVSLQLNKTCIKFMLQHRCQWRWTCLLFLHQSCPIFETHELLPCGSDVMLTQCLMSRHGRQEPLYCSPAHTSPLKQKQEHSHQMSHLPTLVPLLNHEIKT